MTRPTPRTEPKTVADALPRETTGLPRARPTESVELADGAEFELRITPVALRLGKEAVRMLAYNGSVPGPTLRVQQGSELIVDVVNEGDLENTVHWHGLRLDNRYDGTAATQRPIPVGGSFRYRLHFPDPGVYWYHPHVREDYGQELGLYGNIVVAPSEPDYWPPVHRELTLTLDDLLLDDGKVAPFSRSEPSYTAMGRFGNVFLVNGERGPSLGVQHREVVRFYLTNTANARVFNVMLRGARMKLVGGDSGRCEREEFVESVVLAPSERAVVDVLFEETGRLTLEHRTPERAYPLATIVVRDEAAAPSLAAEFGMLRTNPDLLAERERVAPHLRREPDKFLSFVAAHGHAKPHSAHAEAHGKHGHGPHGAEHHPPRAEQARVPPGIEWEDDMVELNRRSTPANTRWKVIDRATGAEGSAIDWRFRVGDQVKLRLINELASDHPMHHPFHVHGAGRFLVLARDSLPEANLVWKDTVLVTTGQTVDILLDVTNPGVWMAHCHIPEHHEAGMMLSFHVEP